MKQIKETPYHHGNLRNQLIEAGIELINEEGLKGFSLRKAAMRCGVSHTAPYSHFRDKDELISAIGEHITGQFMDKLHNAIKGSEDSPVAVLYLGRAYIDFFIENPQYYQFLFYHSGLTIDLDNENPTDYAPFAIFRTAAYKLFTARNVPREDFSKNLISLWSVVHGIASLLTNNGIKYSGDWSKIFTGFIKDKEELV